MNRRELLKGAAVASVAAAVPVVAIAKSAPDRSAWDQAFADYEKAQAEDATFDRVFRPISTARSEAIKALPLKPLPNDRYVGRYSPCNASPHDEWRWQEIKTARRHVEEWDSGQVRVEDIIREEYEQHIAVCREVIAIDEERKAAIREIEARVGYTKEAEDHWEKLGELRWEAERRLLCDAPAPDADALLFKLERLHAEDRSLSDWEEVMADARRLLSHGRA